MKGEPVIAVQLACAYCFSKLIFSQPAITLATKSGALAREGKVAELKCPHCDSVFEIHMTTKRKRAGSGYKRAEAKKREIHDSNVAAAIQRNREIAKQLLAQPGCTCGESIERLKASGVADARFAQYGHSFQSTAMSYGIPTAPHHNHGCPCRGTDDEAAIRGEKKGAA